MPERDIVAWNVLTSCCVRPGCIRFVYTMMQSRSNGCEPDHVTCLHLLQACAHLNALEFGEKKFHKYIDEHGYGDAVNLSNSLMTMYSQTGRLDKACEVFKGMRNKNVQSTKEAIEAFREMQKLGVQPDDQTFTGVLSACSHCGLVDAGLMFFDCISNLG
ncbi:pentatricopeptide repeat-containing protein [Quercus suber]|uniref:Pentatricopeptide repeat-containing protein n=1 Tax=Quercus suber TaxID=58331 RepID=A0AAW0LXR8_QUESU